MGIQTTYEPTLKAIRRHNDWPRITHIMERLVALDTMHLHLDLIVGLPYEDYGHLRQSFNDIYSLRPHKLQIGFSSLKDRAFAATIRTIIAMTPRALMKSWPRPGCLTKKWPI